MQYLILLASIIFFTGLEFLIHILFKNNKKTEHIFCEIIIPCILIAIFVCRYFAAYDVQSYGGFTKFFSNFGTGIQQYNSILQYPKQQGYNITCIEDLLNYLNTSDAPTNFNPSNFSETCIQSRFLCVIGNILLWLEITAAILVLLRPFTHFKTAKWYVKFIATPILLLSCIFVSPIYIMLQGLEIKGFVYYMLPIEIGGLFSLCLYYWAKDYKEKISKHSYPEVAAFSVLINFATIPVYMPSYFFGTGTTVQTPINMSIYHRIFIYVLLLIVPLGIYFSLRNASKDKRLYTLRIIAIGTFLQYFTYTKGVNLLEPWNWPLHLCNLAMVLILISYLFLPKRIYYFTYFINVFGAILAMLMPNYDEASLIFEPSVLHFWFNHCCAFFMPLLGVALKIYDRPKIKQYFFASLAFLGYYIVVLFANPINTVLGHETDFFFINSNFIADKLGNWANSLFQINADLVIKDQTFTFHPVYQLIYFVVYVCVGFGVWFVYQLFFDISDSHYDLYIRLKGISADKIALESRLDGRSLDEPMDKNAGIKLELKNFSKKYGLSQVYAVENASLEVFGGEVFGFLGPNGAGKSTIIKSIVGIQPITSGDIYVCGYEVKTQSVQSKAQIGFVPDHYALYEKLTGREYLNYIADIYEVSKEDRDARLSEYIKIFELESSIDNKIKTYSHGMKQKITIISALVHDPKVWILDEPLTGLDPQSIYQVKECMKKHAEKGNIVFFSSHLIDIVEKLCDRIAIIKHGHIECVMNVKDIEKTGMSLEDFYMSIIKDNK